MRILLALLLVACAPALAQSPAKPWEAEGLDHIMLWTDDIDRTTSVFTVKLGFQVVPGGDFGDGVANRLLKIGDRSYLELLYTTRERSKLGASTRAQLEELGSGTGARIFAVHPRDIDQADRFLRSQGFAPDPPSSMTYDPDGAGPLPATPALWRSLSFPKSPFTFGDLFLINYAENAATPEQRADRAVQREHPNGTAAWSSIWLLSSDVDADAKTFERMGFASRGAIDLPQIGARGIRLQVGPDTIALLTPQGDGLAAKALAQRGTHIIGLSLGVADIGLAQRIVQRGYGVKLARYAGAHGESFLAPTHGELGHFVEFHALPR
jgi:catechol 2,3-dioxygenase-like lactoylglutathione lyase family enzyme